MTLRLPAFVAGAIGAFVACLVASSSAQAACRTITTPLPAGYDPADGCYYPAAGYVPLWWSNECVGFSVQQAASKQVTWTAADATAQSAFAKWTAASCSGGGSPSVQIQDQGAVACATVEFSEAGPNQHVIIFQDETWPHADPNNTLALTTVTFDSTSGEILDADMEINTAQQTIVTTTPVPSGAYDLESILTHEAGHFLGLAHTPDTKAVMFAHYQPGSTSLTADDVSGICSIYLPSGDRVTTEDQNGTYTSKDVQAAACNAAPIAGFGSACGPIGAVPVKSSCSIAAGVGAAGGAAGGTGRGALGLLIVAAALAVGRRRANLSGMRMKRLRSLATCTLLATATGVFAYAFAEREAHASVVITALFDEVVRDSSAAALVTPVEQHATWENGRIYTYTRLHIDQAVAGSLVSDPWVRTLGGTVGKLGQIVDGEAVLTVGKQGLLFLQPARDDVSGVYEVTARAQGQFPVVLDEKNVAHLVHSSGVGGLVPTPQARIDQITQLRAASGLSGSAPTATGILHQRLVADGVTEVATAWTRIHGAAH